jgi:hypothetical protein
LLAMALQQSTRIRLTLRYRQQAGSYGIDRSGSKTVQAFHGAHFRALIASGNFPNTF